MTNDELNTIQRLTFVNCFPDNISANIQQSSGIMTMSMPDIISRARILSSKVSESNLAAVIFRNMPIMPSLARNTKILKRNV